MGLFNSIRLGSSAAGDYEIERSVRFNGDRETNFQQFRRTGGSTVSTYTISMWAKNCGVGTGVYRMLFSIGQENDANAGWNGLTDSDTMGFQGGNGTYLTSTEVFRDPSAWFHYLISVNSNNFTTYINGASIKTGTIRSLDTSTNGIRIGINYGTTYPWDGYIADYHLIDGQALTPSSFTKTDAITGELIPIKYSGSYGSEGAHLTFEDNSGTTATTLGKDSSGNGNNYTPSGDWSVAAGVGNDSVTDTPTNNFCTFNPLKVNHSAPIVFKEGLLQHNGVSGNNHLRSATTMQVTSGKWYVEFKFVSGYETTNGTVGFGICTDAGHRDSNNDAAWYENSNNFLALQYRNDGEVVRSEVGTSTDELTGLSTFVNGDVMGLAVDLDNDKFFISKNGTWFSNGTGTQDPANGTNPLYSGGVLTSRKSDGFYFNISGYSAQVVSADFGQHGYAYTPPTGFKAVNTANLPDPTIKQPNKHFDILLWTGNNTDNRAITGLNFQPDFTWIKRRSGGGMSHFVVHALGSYTDSSGNGNVGPLATNDTYAESNALSDGGFESFNSDGFTLGKGSSTANAAAPYQRNNASSETYVGWNWKGSSSTVANSDGSISSSVRVNASAGFSVAGWTGTNGNGTVGHGLGVAPKVVIIRRRASASSWVVYHEEVGNTKRLTLDSAGAECSASANWFNNTSPTSTTFSVGSDGGSNGSTDTYVAWCFSEVGGYSKFGSYIGNNNANGAFVPLGFRPALVLIKNREAGSTAWYMLDNKRDPDNPAQEYLAAEDSAGEGTYVFYDFLSNGFKLRNTGSAQNPNGQEVIYMAFAESPFRYSRAR